ncbi:N(2)-acetyl-L-2,4-diaminobutanoate deacetylase DoeB [Actibacterium pelagium]|uniref:N-alpha-acetyl diaminobutyric acid deacetylase DoeB n=1 Tax=Actibacterium pelagium TaxID=2029103 RepID=A0A917AM73_9RHOB|nr:N(2)-acetyl-L-2,4-diaminobutanoate deacetylase DoeB [Actibacterium pelagium]GGE61631.1 N-alpha-acetyl diaminobutyric acid deacetylase DoeB [Actibacterium pelagium]
MTAINPISSTVPFDQDGEFHGFLSLPHSQEDSAWGLIQIPISVFRNGDGPTALLTGANHGDEYEGPIALQSLTHDLSAEDVQGRVIIVPYMNYPAFRAGRRISPVDGLNMNRIFPGKPDGTVTEKIADYFLNQLIPLADIVLDYHSGGKSLDFIPFAAAHLLEDKAQEAACIAAMEAFGAPYSMTLKEIDPTGMYDTAAEDAGKVFISTELGGGGSATARSAGIARRGAENILRHAGILQGEPASNGSTRIDTTGGDCFHFSPCDGMLEMLFDLEDEVAKGDTIARIWPSDRSGQKPAEVVSKESGILAARHFPGLIRLGDCLAVVAIAG